MLENENKRGVYLAFGLSQARPPARDSCEVLVCIWPVRIKCNNITYFLLSETKRHIIFSRCQKDTIKIWHLAGGVEKTQFLQTCSHGSNYCFAGSRVIPVVFVRIRFCLSHFESSDDFL